MTENAKRFHCPTCRWGRHCDKSNPAPRGDHFEIEGVIQSSICLLPMITPASDLYIRLYRHYRNGVLPFAGGLLDQPQHYLEAMEVLDPVYQQIEAERIKQAWRDAGD